MKYQKTARLAFFTGMALSIPITGFSEVAGVIQVFAYDSSSAASPPPSATATLDGIEDLSYGTNQMVAFSGYYEEGMHTVEVATASNGYLPRQSPTDPNAVNDPDSDYGNPRRVSISEAESTPYAVFLFDPVVTATGVVRDGWTMERLAEVDIEFIWEGPAGSIVKRKYPSNASYATHWVTDAAGGFPADTILYVHDYDLSLEKTGYESLYSSNVIANAAAGDSFDFGTLYLYPVDANTNQISDAWETAFFGSSVLADADADGDGMSNMDEYVAGTDPTNGYHHLWLEAIPATNGLALAWYTEPDRTYCVSGTTNLYSNDWVQVGGPWEATSNQSEMVWVETNLDLSWNSNYRIDVVPCSWMGTNSVLINTNQPYSSGGGTNTWPGGGPPIP